MRSLKIARILGGLVGFGLAAGFVATGQIPAGNGDQPTEIVVASETPKSLELIPKGKALSSTAEARSSRSALTGQLSLRNATNADLDVDLDAAGEPGSRDDDLEVRVKRGPKTLFSGRLGELRRGAAGSFRLPGGNVTDLHVRAWWPLPGANGLPAREKVTLRWTSKRPGR